MDQNLLNETAIQIPLEDIFRGPVGNPGCLMATISKCVHHGSSTVITEMDVAEGAEDVQ